MKIDDTKKQNIDVMKKQLDQFRQINKKLQDNEAAKKKKEKQDPSEKETPA